jgi:taurine dioxygenase
MQIDRMSPHVGAVVSGFDCDKLADEATRAELQRGLHRHGVLFFRELGLAAAELRELACVFGRPIADSHPKFGALEGYPEIAIVTNDAHNPPDINVWHTDTTFMRVPAGVCVLKCEECPSPGGDTLWSSMYAAYDALSPGMQRFLASLQAEHRLPLDTVAPERVRSVGDREISAVHPVVRWIPETGRPSLFVNRVYTKRVLGMHSIESRGLLEMLFELGESPDFQVRFSWRKDSIAIWDNRITQHFAVADYFPARRVMHRIALFGEAPLSLPG